MDLNSVLGALLGDPAASARRLAAVTLSLARNRLELFSIELAEERERLVAVLLWAGLGLTFTLLFLVVGTFAVIYLLDGQARVYALLAFAGAYLLAALLCLWAVRARLGGPRPFAQTIDEFIKDRNAL